MNFFLARFCATLVRIFDHWRGDRDMRLLAVNDSPHEAYRINTTNGGRISIYCTETVYRITYAKWWVPDKKHYTYRVFGECNDVVPHEFADYIRRGINLGRLLPSWASRADQKKAAIHACVSLLASELEHGDRIV